jgi:transcriptional regulator with XRE-family HTH domain
VDPIYRRLGRAIRERREALNLNQRDLAAATGLSRASISNVEAGRQQIYVHHLVAIARGLSVTVPELMATDEDPVGHELASLDKKARAFVEAGLRGQSK